jgi:hypothetical protein
MTSTNRDEISTEKVTDAAHESGSVGNPSASAPSSTPSEGAAISVDETLDSTAAEQAVMGVAEPASSIPVAAPRAKTRGVADIVFLIDISGSMKPCIDALRANIELFIDFLSAGNANEGLRDWRGKVVGYRDFDAAEGDGLPWIVDNPFVRNASDMKNQLGWLEAAGGGDEPESLLDALYTVSTMDALPKGAPAEDPAKWRYRSDAARVVIVFTDASFKETMSLPQARGGSLQDVANAVMANRIILSLFAPNFEGYDRMSQIDKCEWEVVEYDGLSPQEALRQFTADPANFRTTLKQLAASVSRSAETIAL